MGGHRLFTLPYRQAGAEAQGDELKITILRFKDEEVYYSMEKVLNVIECWIKKNTPPTPL
jgi:hypothetical protein